MALAFQVLHALLIVLVNQMETAYAMLVLLTTADFVPSALQVLYGAHLPINASMSVVKIQPSPHQPMPVSATQVSASKKESVKSAPSTTSFPTDTASHAQ